MTKCKQCGQLLPKIHYFKLENNKYNCLFCCFQTDSFMGIQSHIRKHKKTYDSQQTKIEVNK